MKKTTVLAAFVVVGFVVMAILWGCGPKTKPESEWVIQEKIYRLHEALLGYVIRVVDVEAGVVCYIYYGEGGIDCLPLEDTKLGR